MKKTLITILLAILMSVGAFASTGNNNVYAEESENIPVATSLIKVSDKQMMLTISENNLDTAIIEYSFYSNGVLMSKLYESDLIYNTYSSSNNSYQYVFSIPEEALSVIVWRVITSDNDFKSLEGTFEYTYTDATAIDMVETRIKTLYIEDDVITKELALSSIGGITTNNYTFYMYFNIEDIDGNKIPIDSIYSLEVEYDIVYNYLWGLFSTTNHVEKSIVATEERNATYWPWIYPESVITYISSCWEVVEYDWKVNLGTFSDVDGTETLKISDVTLDQTSILTISYFYDGVFYDRAEVVDHPYDEEDIYVAVPGTIEPATTLVEALADLSDSFSLLLGGIALIAIVVILIYLHSFLKGLFFILKFIFWKLPKFIFYQLPKGICSIMKFLFIPKKKRKEQKRYVGRYI